MHCTAGRKDMKKREKGGYKQEAKHVQLADMLVSEWEAHFEPL